MTLNNVLIEAWDSIFHVVSLNSPDFPTCRWVNQNTEDWNTYKDLSGNKRKNTRTRDLIEIMQVILGKKNVTVPAR